MHDPAGAGNMFAGGTQRSQVTFACNEDIFGLLPAGNSQKFGTQQIDALVGLGRKADHYRVGFAVPWLNGREMCYASLGRSLGPHSGGFHTSNGFQQGVGFVPQGE